MSRRVLIVCLGLLTGAPQWTEAVETRVRVIQPERDFAYTLGDVLLQQIVLQESKAQPDLSVLNSAVRISDWLERQEATLLHVGGEQLLQLRYQIVNAPESIRFAELPGLSLTLSDDSTLEWQAWPFSLGPLSVADGTVVSAAGRESERLKADDLLAPIDVHLLQKSLYRVAVIFGISISGWCIWWVRRSLLDRHRLPFARAVHGLKQQRPGSDPQTLEAWKTVHEAFNVTAGQVVMRADVGGLLERLPWLNALDAQVDAFFDESSARFFSQPPQARPFDLLAFAQRLACEEKRNAI